MYHNTTGYCLCGCGGKTKLIEQNNAWKGHIKGEYVAFLPGHGKRLGSETSYHVDENGCWIWEGKINNTNYGVFVNKELAHRHFYERDVGLIPDGYVLDHICHNTLCVNPEHLRLATVADNIRYQKLHKNNTSGFKGVSWYKGRNKWYSYITVNRKKIHLGYFDDVLDAARAYDDAALKYFKEFAKLNFEEAI